ncbi:MAG TPA: PEP-CTERM sorting domain-containing protein, partial [Pseudoduganella sp.]
MSLHRFIATATVAALLCCTGAAQADITTYTSQSAYLAAVGNTGVDTFDDLIRETYPGPFARTAGEHAYTVTTGPANPDL